jgi:predicted unusual protein kinase regulating ubiquinone biosynthesis (AarF/ABC1/UbiB family)
MTMGIYVSLVDKLNTPSPLISNYMSYSGRTSVVTAVYLPGNALSETVGIESHEFDSERLGRRIFRVYFGERMRKSRWIAASSLSQRPFPWDPYL